jgi:hypothetical protein
VRDEPRDHAVGHLDDADAVPVVNETGHHQEPSHPTRVLQPGLVIPSSGRGSSASGPPTATERSMNGEHAPRCDPRPEPTHHTARRAGAKPL